MAYIKITIKRENMFRTNRQCRLFVFAFCLAIYLTMATSIRVRASSQFDGTYSYSYTYEWSGSWSTKYLGDVLTVSNGEISMTGSSAFYGSVDSSGYVEFVGPSPMGGEQATFSGSISGGSGGGTWSSPSGAHGNWNVTLVSGGAGFEIGGDPVSWSIAAVAGTVVFGGLAATYRHNVSRRKKLQAQVQSFNQTPQKMSHYTAQPITQPLPRSNVAAGGVSGATDAPSSQPLPPLNPITGGSGHHLEDYGVVSVAPSEATTLPYMNATWFPGGVSLTWGRPQYDPSRYRLLQFDISQMTYGPNSTVPQPTAKTVVLDDGHSTAFTENRLYGQTYTNSTGGDVAGFRVDPLFQDLQTGRTFHTGGLGVKIGQATGTYGIGP
jgi:hypothetical protein